MCCACPTPGYALTTWTAHSAQQHPNAPVTRDPARRPNEDHEVRAASAAIPPWPCSWLHTVLVAYWSMVAAIAHGLNTAHTPCTPII